MFESTEASRQFITSPDRIVFLSLVEQVYLALSSGRKILFCGNGGSAAESTHIAAEFLGKCVNDVGPQAAISLNDSISAITAIANDWDFGSIFARQVEALAFPGDVLIGLSTSGKSRNVLKALEVGKVRGAITSMWTSELFNGEIEVDYLIQVSSTSTPRIQEVHLQLGHILSELVAMKRVGSV